MLWLSVPIVGARADDLPRVSPFIADIASLGVYVGAAPACGVRSIRWSRDLFDAIVDIIERTRDGNAANVPSSSDVMNAMERVRDAHRNGEKLVHLKPSSSCQNMRASSGLARADALVGRHRDLHRHRPRYEVAL